jgi:S-adenosylmethionine:tRNA ribosyltransferase-isomerase
VQTSDFNYDLPPELIAQQPTPARDQSRLLIVDRAAKSWRHGQFPDLLSLLHPGDVLVLNNSKVIPARLRGRKETGGVVEILLLEETVTNQWWCLLKPGKRVRAGTEIQLEAPDGNQTNIVAIAKEKDVEGRCLIEFTGDDNILNSLGSIGQIPLPPYIQRNFNDTQNNDLERYQTVFAEKPGSVAAPTAGLHYTPDLLQQARAKGVKIHEITLHVGLGTFLPVKSQRLAEHKMHSERFSVPPETAAAVNLAKTEGRRVVATGTTSVRVLESVAANNKGRLIPGAGRTEIFIFPPSPFRIVDALVTNFHLPKSTLLMLVSAFATPGELEGRGLMLSAYAEAVLEKYRFFSYGDAMFIS